MGLLLLWQFKTPECQALVTNTGRINVANIISKFTSLHKIGIKLHKINKINIYPNNIYGILIVCCLISAPKVSKWLAHDLVCFSDVKGVA